MRRSASPSIESQVAGPSPPPVSMQGGYLGRLAGRERERGTEREREGGREGKKKRREKREQLCLSATERRISGAGFPSTWQQDL